MKRIIAIILTLTLAFALFSCGECTEHVDANKDAKCDECGAAVACATCVDENKDAKCDVCGKAVACAVCVDADKNGKCDVCGNSVAVNAFEDFEAAVSAADPSGFDASISLDTAAGVINGEYSATIADDGSITIAYTFDSFNEIGQGGAEDVTSKKEGTKNVSAADAALAGSVTAIKLDKELMNYNIVGGTLSASVESANTQAVFGVELASDATFVLIINEGKVVSLALSYEVEGAGVSVVCEYK